MKTLTAGEETDKIFSKLAVPVLKCHICVVLKAVRWYDNVDFKLSWKRPVGQPHFSATSLPAIFSLKISSEIHIISKKDLETTVLYFRSSWLFFCLIIQLDCHGSERRICWETDVWHEEF